METTGKALVDFWKWVGDKGLVNANTATGVKAASTQVLGVLDNWESLDVKALDPEDVFKRFMNKRGREFTPASLATYRRRFNFGLTDFLSYAAAPDTWKPNMQDRPARKEKRGVPAEASAATGSDAVDLTSEPAPIGTATTARSGLVEYPFPLREGRFAYLRLPADLNASDVKRLNAYLAALVIDDSGS